jgi:hypothetical protein
MILMTLLIAASVGRNSRSFRGLRMEAATGGGPPQLHDKSLGHGMNIARLCGIARIGNPAC